MCKSCHTWNGHNFINNLVRYWNCLFVNGTKTLLLLIFFARLSRMRCREYLLFAPLLYFRKINDQASLPRQDFFLRKKSFPTKIQGSQILFFQISVYHSRRTLFLSLFRFKGKFVFIHQHFTPLDFCTSLIKTFGTKEGD